jgi:hypothetical protein
MFSGHEHVSVEPIGDRLPPESYRVEFRLRGLWLDGEQPQVREVHHVDIVLPRRYPAERPCAVPLEPIFHPNIRDYFCIADYWAAGTTLADVIAKLGDMIQWRVYNPASPLDASAAKWAIEQEPTGLFPVGDVSLGVADVEIEVHGAAHPRLDGTHATDKTIAKPARADEELVVLVRSSDRPASGDTYIRREP